MQKYVPTATDMSDMRKFLVAKVRDHAHRYNIRTTDCIIADCVENIIKEKINYVDRWRASPRKTAGYNAGCRMWEAVNKAGLESIISDNGSDAFVPEKVDRADWEVCASFAGEADSAGTEDVPVEGEGAGEAEAENGEESESEGAGAGEGAGEGAEGEEDDEADGEAEAENGEESEDEDESVPPEESEAEAKDTLSNLLNSNLLDALVKLIDARIASADIKGGIDADEVARMIAEAVKGASPTERIEIKIADAIAKVDGMFHPKFPRILSYVLNGQNVYLYGPAGTGKSTVVEQVGKALGLPVYYYQALMSKYDILGRVGLDGNYVPSEFYKAFTEGGIVLVDEMDASVPEAIVAINTALANGKYAFPTGTVSKHPDFHFIGAGNTIGKGADMDMTGRYCLDQASLDRFALVYMGYVHSILLHTANGDEVLTKYFEDVQRLVRENGLSLAVTPRSITRIVSQMDYFDHPDQYRFTIPNGIAQEDYICAVLLYEGLFKGMDSADIATLAYALEDDNRWTRATKLLANDRLRDGFEA